MRFDAPISYNGWTASATFQAGGRPMSGYVVERFGPSQVQVDQYLDKRALQDGMDADDVFLGARQFTGIVSVFGSTWGDFWDKAQSLLAAFSPTLAFAADTAALGFLPFDFFQPTAKVSTWPTSAYPNGIPMRYYVRPFTPPTYDLSRDEMGGSDGNGMSARFALSLIARDPRKYLQSTVTLSVSGNTQTVTTYRGDYPTFPVMQFSLSSAGGSAMTFTVNGFAATLNMSSETSGDWSLDFATGLLLRGTTPRPDLITSATAFSEIEMGSTYVGGNAQGVIAGTRVMTFREAWA